MRIKGPFIHFFELNTFSVKELQRAAAVERQQMWLCTHLKSQGLFTIRNERRKYYCARLWIQSHGLDMGRMFLFVCLKQHVFVLKAPPFDRITAEGKNVRSATDVSFEGGLAKQNAVWHKNSLLCTIISWEQDFSSVYVTFNVSFLGCNLFTFLALKWW